MQTLTSVPAPSSLVAPPVQVGIKMVRIVKNNVGRKMVLIVKNNVSFDFSFLLFFIFAFLRGHSVFSSPPQLPMTSYLKRFPSQILFISYFVLSYFMLKSQYFHFNVECQTREILFPFNNVFGMTRPLSGIEPGTCTHWMPALYH